MDWLAGAWAVFEKDLRLELRARYALNTLGMFVASSLLLVGVAVGPEGVAPREAAAFLWIVIVFAAAVGLGRAFVAEEERGTTLLLRLHLRGSMVYAGKLLFNVVLVGAMNALAALGFVLVLGLPVEEPGLLAAALALGAVGLAGVTTLLSALIARAAGAGRCWPCWRSPCWSPCSSRGSARDAAGPAAPPPGGAWGASVDDLVALVRLRRGSDHGLGAPVRLRLERLRGEEKE
jgi:heme exporter protein B